jgi:hypothetical protein
MKNVQTIKLVVLHLELVDVWQQVHVLHYYYRLNVMVSQLVNGHLNVLKMLLVLI